MLIQEVLDLGWRDPVSLLDQVLNRAELLDQLDGGLLADAANPRDVVRDVADQALEIDGLDRLQAIALANALRGVQNRLRHPPLAGQHEDIVIHELQRIQVAGDDRAVQA